jgi:hypothetical protein
MAFTARGREWGIPHGVLLTTAGTASWCYSVVARMGPVVTATARSAPVALPTSMR